MAKKKTGPTPLQQALPSDYAYMASSAGDITTMQGFIGERYPAGKSPLKRAQVAPTHDQTLQPPAYIPIIWFGKMHYISPELYKKDAAKYHELHWKDAFLLLDSLHTNRDVLEEWCYPSRFFDSMTAGISTGVTSLRLQIRQWATDIEQASKPDLKEFDKLIQRTLDVIERMASEELDADKVAKDGIDLEIIRNDAKRFMQKVEQFRQASIDSAEHIEGGLETVESASFQILNLVPTITFMDPIREAVYKIGVLLLRASARGVGGYTAWGTMDAALDQAWGIIRSEAPNVIVDCVMAPINRVTRTMGLRGLGRWMWVTLVQQLIEFTCAVYKAIKEMDNKDFTEEQFNNKCIDLLEQQAVSLVGAIISRFMPASLADKAKKTLVKAVVEATLKTLAQDLATAAKIVRDNPSRGSVLEVMVDDIPGTLMRIFQATVMGVIQRRAQQVGQVVEREQTKAEGTSFSESYKIMKETEVEGDTEVSQWARPGTGMSKALEENRKAGLKPLPPLLEEEWAARWKQTNLDLGTAQGTRRFAHEMNKIVIGMDPAESRLIHTADAESRGASAPKPMGVKGKSTDNPQYGLDPDGTPNRLRKNLGLVLKPHEDPTDPGKTTHSPKRIQDAMKLWREEEHHMFEQGFMVSPDGVLFHPAQLKKWAVMHPEDLDECMAAYRTLKELSAGGTNDMTLPVKPASTGQATADRIDRANALLARVKVGFYSDHDLVEVVDAATGQRRFMGDLGEDKEVLQFGRDHREQMNAMTRIHDYDYESLPDDPAALARIGDAVQHGGNAEVVKLLKAYKVFSSKKVDPASIKVKLKDVHMVFPDGKLVHITEQELEQVYGFKITATGAARADQVDDFTRQAIEIELKKYLGPEKYQTFADRVLNLRRRYAQPSKKLKVQGKQPPDLTIPQLATIQGMTFPVEVMDEPGLGKPVQDIDIIRSLRARKLSIDEHHIAKATASASIYDVRMAVMKHKTFIGVEVDEDGNTGSNIVIAVNHYQQTVGEAVEALIRTRMALGNVSTGIKVWYEIYTAYWPVSTDFVRDRLGGADPGIKPSMDDLAKAASCFGKRKNKRVYAFCTTGFVETYTPGKKQAQEEQPPPEGADKGHWETINGLKVYVSDDGEVGDAIDPEEEAEKERKKQENALIADPRPIHGLRLTEVWEDTVRKDIDDYHFTQASEAGQYFAVFPESLVVAAHPEMDGSRIRKRPEPEAASALR